MAKIISIANQKGGVGKTTTAVNFCASLKHRGRRVLLCDCDPQANATSGMGVSKAGHAGVYDIMVRSLPAAEAIVSTKFGDVLPSNGDLAGANVELVDVENREFMLKEALKPLDEQYDYIILDCPPSLELLTLNTLCASNTVLVPVQCEYYALEGLSDLMDTIRAVNRSFNHELEIEGVVLTMYDSRTRLSLDVAEAVRKHFGSKVYETAIPRNVRLSEAPSHGMPCLGYDRMSKGARAYLRMTNEFLKRQ